MTGRDLIIYILKNGLEDELVFKDGKFIGFITISDAAAKMGVGVSTVAAWISQGKIDASIICGTIYVRADFDQLIKTV